MNSPLNEFFINTYFTFLSLDAKFFIYIFTLISIPSELNFFENRFQKNLINFILNFYEFFSFSMLGCIYIFLFNNMFNYSI